MIKIKKQIPDDFQFGVEFEFGFTKLPTKNKIKNAIKSVPIEEYIEARDEWFDPDESCIEEDVLRLYLQKNGVNISNERGDRSERKKKWCLGYDGSVYVGHGPGLELRSPPLKGQKGIDEMKRVLAILKEFARKTDSRLGTNTSCGLHVHVDISKMNFESIKSIIYFYSLFENEFDSIHHPSRKNNEFAESMRYIGRSTGMFGSNSWRDPLEVISSIRSMNSLKRRLGVKYRKLYMHQYYTTLEFRQHVGTLNTKAVVDWITVISSIYRAAQKIRFYRQNTRIKSLNNVTINQLRRERKLKVKQLRTILTQEA